MLQILLKRKFLIRPCIHRLFPLSLCPCSLVTRQTNNEPLFLMVSGYKLRTTLWIRPLGKTKVYCLCGESQLNKGTRQSNSLWIQDLKRPISRLTYIKLLLMKCVHCITLMFITDCKIIDEIILEILIDHTGLTPP